MDVHDFVRESNRIEGILRDPTGTEYGAHRKFLGLATVTVGDLVRFVSAVQPDAILRDREGLDVRVGNHRPPPGHPGIAGALGFILDNVTAGVDAYTTHQRYETLHPFTDGNGRSGRALWLWQMIHQSGDRWALKRGFLHTWYYQSLAARDQARSAHRASPAEENDRAQEAKESPSTLPHPLEKTP